MECPELKNSSLGGLDKLVSLRALEIDFPIAAAGLRNVAGLTALESLKCSIGELTLADVEPLAHLVHLKKLELASARSSTRLPRLTEKNQADVVAVGNALARVIGGLPALEELSLALTMPMDNAGLESLVTAGTGAQARGQDLSGAGRWGI